MLYSLKIFTVKKLIQLTIILFSILLLHSCDKNEVTVPDLGYRYFPTRIGSYVIYECDSIKIDDFAPTFDTIRFEMLEEIESEFTDLENRRAVRVERSIRFDENDPWEFKEIITFTRTAERAELWENNHRYVKMNFPIFSTPKWDANLFNIMEEAPVKITEKDIDLTLNGNSFDSTMTVILEVPATLTRDRTFTEKYAKGTGLIFKAETDVTLEFRPDTVIEKLGYKFTKTIKEHGIR